MSPKRFPARFSALADLLSAAVEACRTAGLDDAATHRVELVLEEAFSNTIRHGYGVEGENPVWLACCILPDGVKFVFQDAAPPFDPLRNAALPVDGRPGGVGRMLMKNLPRRAAYALEDGRNTCTLEFGPTGGTPPA